MSDPFSYGDERDAFTDTGSAAPQGGGDWVERLTGVPAPANETIPQLIARLTNPQNREMKYTPQYTLPDVGMRVGRTGTPAITTEETLDTTPFVTERPERIAPNTVPYRKFPARPEFTGTNEQKISPRTGPDANMAPMPSGAAKPKPPVHKKPVEEEDEDTSPGSLAEAKHLFPGRPLQQAIYYTDPKSGGMRRLGVGADTKGLNPDNIARIWEPADMSGGERAIRGAFETPGENPVTWNPPKKRAEGGAIHHAQKIAEEKRTPCHHGIINMAVGGRTDHIPMNVLEGSYVLPADIVSGLGEGNTLAGTKIIDSMFSSNPYGVKSPKFASGRKYPSIQEWQLAPTKAAHGGRTEARNRKPIPIIAAGGEYVIHPDVVEKIGKGDMTKGHEWLDHFVKNVRSNLVKTLKKLPGPKRD